MSASPESQSSKSFGSSMIGARVEISPYSLSENMGSARRSSTRPARAMVGGLYGLARLDQDMSEIIPRSGSDTQPVTVVNFPALRASSRSDDATVALDMVSQAAAAIKDLEQQSAEAVSRAHNVAKAVIEKLYSPMPRRRTRRTAQSEAETQVAELTAAAAVTRNDLEMLQTRLAAKEAELAAAERRASLAEQRAGDAERRANDANAAIERIVDAIRTQLPLKLEAVAPKQISSN